jgi:hypothetical protein
MKINYTYLFLLFFTTIFYAQTGGIGYQAVISKPNLKSLPGMGVSTTPLANTKVCLRFSFLDGSSVAEYQEIITVTTDKFGMVNTTIGLGNQSAGYASSFNAILWNDISKSLVVELDENGLCNSFTEISKQPFSTAPFAFNAITANNVSGVVAIINGGTGATTATKALLNLGAERLDNKSTSIANDATSDEKYASVKSIVTYVDTKFSGGVADADLLNKGKIQLAGDLAGTAVAPTVPGLLLKANLASPAFTGTVSGIDKTMVGLANVDNTTDVLKPISTATKIYVDAQVAGATIADADALSKGKIQLAGDLAGTAAAPTVPGLILKANLASPAFTGTVSGIDKTMVGLANVDNTTDVLKPISTATQTALDMKASSSDLALKAAIASPSFTGTPVAPTAAAATNTTQIATTEFVSTAVASATIASATTALEGKIQLAGDLSGTATAPTVPGLILKANLASPAFTGTVSGIDKTMVGLTNVDNTKDELKPISTATQTALDMKASSSDLALKAAIASPSFTGTPVAPTAAAATNTTQIATTAFVAAAFALVPNLYSADGTLASARIIDQNNLDLTFSSGTAKTIVNGNFKQSGAVFRAFETTADSGYTVPATANTVVFNGTSAAIWTLPSAASSMGMELNIINASTVDITFVSGTMSNTTANPVVWGGTCGLLFCDGLKWFLLAGGL